MVLGNSILLLHQLLASFMPNIIKIEQTSRHIQPVYEKLMNTPSMIISPSIILLQPHVGRFLASDLEKILISDDGQAMFGHQVGVWHCMGV